MAKYNFQQIAAAWISKNNPDGVRGVLVSQGLVSDIATAARLSQGQLADILYKYYLSNGKAAYGQLLSVIPVNGDISATETAIINAASADIRRVFNIQNVTSQNISAETTQDFSSGAKKFWDLLVGTSTSETSPTVTTSTKSSPLTIGLIIGGVAVLAIIAWVVVKY